MSDYVEVLAHFQGDGCSCGSTDFKLVRGVSDDQEAVMKHCLGCQVRTVTHQGAIVNG